MRRLVVTGTLVMSLGLSACGGVVPEEDGAADVATAEQSLIPHCYRPGMTDSFYVIYYSDSAKTREVGRDLCDCGYPSYWGTKSSYYKVLRMDGCMLD